MWGVIFLAAMAALVVGAFLIFKLGVLAITPSAAPAVGLLFFAACIVVGVAAMRYSTRR
jgi:hypothetical protein